MRAIFFDWLVEVHSKFKPLPQTHYLTAHIVDRFLSLRSVSRIELQLVGIASKDEEMWALEVNDFVCLSDKAYNREHILLMEKRILGKLGWTLTLPTPYHFLMRFIKAAMLCQEKENIGIPLSRVGATAL
ncbi:hypothetical protein GIB67_037161 [Kingdonia uniflora]|uniref:Cyclin-like domain-containing protein n=1 Tax=Kingdonia uniflora TaxID=39325 RepID=A0A7J7MSB8_9MAGN|nr:hypothetical protein GIB67_037161 [Kingdonia uniflora]